jgi:hypothetical protein
MKKFKVYFYTRHNPDVQSGIVNAKDEADARKMFEVTGCDVESIGEVGYFQHAVFCSCFDYIGDNPDCKIHGKPDEAEKYAEAMYNYDMEEIEQNHADSTAWDKERDELRTMGQGG